MYFDDHSCSGMPERRASRRRRATAPPQRIAGPCVSTGVPLGSVWHDVLLSDGGQAQDLPALVTHLVERVSDWVIVATAAHDDDDGAVRHEARAQASDGSLGLFLGCVAIDLHFVEEVVNQQQVRTSAPTSSPCASGS